MYLSLNFFYQKQGMSFFQLVVLAVLFTVVAPAHALTIEEALAKAARENPTLRAAREAARSRHEGVPLALSAWMPTLQAFGSLTESDYREANMYSNSPHFGNPAPHFRDRSDTWSRGLSLTQNLFRSGRDMARLHQASEEVLRSHASVEEVEQTLFLRVATTYLDVIRAKRTVDLRVASLVAFEERYRETEAQFQIGDRTRADLAQAEAELKIASADVVSAKAELAAQRALFEELVGMPPAGLSPADEPPGLPETLEEARHLAQKDHPAIHVAEYGLRAAGYTVKAAAGKLGPSVDLVGSINTADQLHRTTSFRRELDTINRSLSLELTVPLYLAGRVGAEVRQAKHGQVQYRNQLLAARRKAVREATAAWRDLDAARYWLKATAAAVTASQVALEGILREAAIGERTTREVLDAERDFVSRRVSALSAERDVIVRAYTLLGVVGALTSRRLGVEGLPDLDREAEQTRWNLMPGILSIGGD